MNKKKATFDVILNIIASAIPILVLQLLILPIVARQTGDIQYGLLITLVSLATLLSHPFGNVLNNIRLLRHNEYDKNGLNGDYNVLLAASLLMNSLVMIFGTLYFEGTFSIISIILIIMVASSNLIREYLIVAFRITLNFKSILVNNLILGLGYVLGTIVFYFVGYWQLIYIVGSSLSIFYITKNSNLLNEGFRTTILFRKTAYQSIILFFSVFLKTLLNYADKLLLFPLLGPTAVTIYYTATILGKIITRVITPINSVMLSYLAKMEVMKLKNFIYIISITGVISVIGYFATIFISEPLLRILYPNWADESLQLIYITTASTILGVMSSVINPFILRFYNINWQLFISGTNVIVYIICAFLFFNLYGLIGFCFGILVANIFKLLLMISIFLFNRQSHNKNHLDYKAM
ncbi:lipopolysaccharide biosynthesis protein [Halalkalibacter alkalisediminis]|uniref:Lipopolysaccharide biosynthesis protein n=1 Tax=Halalkalibacter alkalisediminis TaxID=935616 RepID=A0ABV6NJE2_9BACI|nr:hypothetical protein [Halalkalibacter alkalisediminis]